MSSNVPFTPAPIPIRITPQRTSINGNGIWGLTIGSAEISGCDIPACLSFSVACPISSRVERCCVAIFIASRARIEMVFGIGDILLIGERMVGGVIRKISLGSEFPQFLRFLEKIPNGFSLVWGGYWSVSRGPLKVLFVGASDFPPFLRFSDMLINESLKQTIDYLCRIEMC